jgi:hypothetical protein
MAGEVILVNARRRRGRRKRARASTRRRRAKARRNPFLYNARRRRRSGRRRAVARRRSRRVHRNPRIPFLGSVNVNGIVGGTAGYLGTRYGAGWLMSLPAVSAMTADPNTGPWIRMALKAAVGLVGLPMIAKALRLRGVAGPIAIGAGIAVAQDLFDTFVKPSLPIADYQEQVISDYVPQTISGGGAYTGGAYGTSAYQM